MLKFSSISFEDRNIRILAFLATFFLGIILYWNSFSGTPVWDDTTFWFFSEDIISQSYLEIWKYATWPLTNSLQKFLYMIGGNNWWFYHSINFLLHTFNAYLVYRLIRTIGLSVNYAVIGFFLFFIHPASVISVAWMIQLKTLVCFGFAFSSLILYLGRKTKAHLYLSYLFFLLSILAKTSSLPFLLVLLFFAEGPIFSRKNLTLIPFLVITLFGAYKINYSNVALTGVKQALESSARGIPKDAQKEEAPLNPITEGMDDQLDDSQEIDSSNKLIQLTSFQSKRRAFIKTLYYYFWQSYLPVNTVPVKGQNPFPPQVWDYVHLVFLALLIIITARFHLFYLLASAHILLLPYFGLIPAPYMNVTWVSDQHLYIALPFFIALALCLSEKIHKNWKIVLCSFFMIFFCYQVKTSAKFYKNNFSFYEVSISHNPGNLPLVYNLAILYHLNQRKDDALRLLQDTMNFASEAEYLKDSHYYPVIVNLYIDLNKSEN